jgi:hypothetical protein
MPTEVSDQPTDQNGPPLWLVGTVPESLPDALHRSALVEANRQRALFRLTTVGRFLVEPGKPTVVQLASGATDQDIECFLRGPVAALRLCLSGRFALRGAAVDIGGRALAVCGVATGTSSLVAALALEGHPVLADGLICIEGNPPAVSPVPEAQPPRVTLWPDSMEALGLDPSSGEIVRVVLLSRAFVLGPPPAWAVPLGAVMALGVGHSPDAALIPERLTGFGAVATMLKAFWHPLVVQDLGMQKEQFKWAASMARTTPTVLLSRLAGEIGSSLGPLGKAALGAVQ